MVIDQLEQAVRHQLGLGRLLPLGDADDGAWLVESAAVAALRAAVSRAVPGVRLGRLRLSPADPGNAAPSAVPAPPSALPPGALHLDADFAATPETPLTTAGDRLRTALLTAADRDLGLRVTRADLRVTDLLDGPDESTRGAQDTGAPRAGTDESASHAGSTEAQGHPLDEHPPAPADHPRATATAETVIAVPGVTRLAPVLGPGLGGRLEGAVSVTDTEDTEDTETRAEHPDGWTPQRGRHLQIQIAVAEDARALDVARAVREAAAKAAAWDAQEPAVPVTVAVLVSAIDPALGSGGERTE